MALVRGDHTLQETKFREALGADELRPADDGEIFGLLGAHPGSLGAVLAHEKAAERGKKLFIVCDKALRERFNLTTGANRDDFHLRGVSPIRDMHVNLWVDIRQVEDGEMCQHCASKLRISKSLEIGHIFKLGTKYSESMGATVLDESGRAVPIVMGSYGIGVERIMASVIEQNHDADGIIWTYPTAPFEVIVTVTNVRNEEMAAAGEKIYKELRAAGLDVLLDDRDERAGVKFKDAELIGIPVRVTVGKRIAENIVEVTERRTKETFECSVEELTEAVRSFFE
jgi:prolyl-tRNA synthetase